MGGSFAIILLLLAEVAAALRNVPQQHLSRESVAGAARRAFVASAFFGGVLAVSHSAEAAEVRAPASVFESTCLGFGCNNYNGLGFGGMAKPDDEDSLAFKEFTDMLQNAETRAKIASVDIYGAAGDRVYATIDGRKFRLGEGLPIEDPKGWSSSLWLVRILDNNSIPHTYHFRPTDKS
jgi:hypothetical protein